MSLLMVDKLVQIISDRLAPVVIAQGAEVEWDKGDLDPDQWEQRGKQLFADFEGRGVRHANSAAS